MSGKAGRKEAPNSVGTVIRWRLRDGRQGKTGRMSRTEAEAAVRELGRRWGQITFEVE